MKAQIFITLSLFSLLAFVNPSNSQVITGVVTHSFDGLPLANVQVTLKGTQVGTLTTSSGSYRIEIDSAHHVLVFSGIGLDVKEINVKGRTIINVSLTNSNVKLEEVVMIKTVEPKKTGKDKTLVNRNYAPSVCYDMAVAEYEATPYPIEHNTEGYTTIHENGFKQVSLNPLSTFSIDVDAASYSNLRRFINSGSLPPVDAVRIEEMINYFNYDYPQPKENEPFSINTELAVCPWNSENYLLHVGLQGKNIPTASLPPSNLVFLIDVSGSMDNANKLPLLKSSFMLLIDQLRPEDRIAIVVYAGNSGLVLPSTPGNQKETIKESLNRLNAGGSTAGGEGLKLAYKVAAENFMVEGNNRIILATDGDFNVGASSNAEMERLIEVEREKGIAISVLGFGMGNFKDDKMEIIADKGNGNYAYIDNLQEAKKVLVNEFGGTLFTIAKDVKFQLEFNPVTVEKYRLIGYENRLLNEEDFNNDKKDAGDMGAGHTVTALYEIVPDKKGDVASQLKYQTNQLSAEALASNDLVTMKLRYKQPDGYQSKLLEKTIKNRPMAIDKTSESFKFSAAVAEFGMLLRNSEFKGTATYLTAKKLALDGKGMDPEGYRGEMIRLIDSAALLSGTAAQK